MIKKIKNSIDNIPKCPICSSKSRFYFSVEESATDSEYLTNKSQGLKTFNIYKCNLCGHGFFYPGVKNQEELYGFYNEKYAENYSPEVMSEDFIKRQKQYKLDLELLENHLPQKDISVLDFGCSTGQFLNAMPSNWKKYGYEVNKFEIDYISKNYKKIKVFSSMSQLKQNSYDVITLRGVIEHLFDFDELFSLINHSLKKKGLVFVGATPDFDSPCSRIYRSQWNQISAPEHYHQFTATSLAILFAKNGFSFKVLHHSYLETPYADPKNDGLKFIKNTQRILNHKKPLDTPHAYPGTIMSLIFEKNGK